MKDAQTLRETLRRIDGRGYKAYKELQGTYVFEAFTLFIDHVQGDPFAQPSRLRVRVDRTASGFDTSFTSGPSRTVALCDYLTRLFSRTARRVTKGIRGTGKGGLILIDTPAQEILPRTAMSVTDNHVEARFFLGLPAFGRRIAGRDAMEMLLSELPAIATEALFFKEDRRAALTAHVECCEDADALREKLSALNRVAFLANGALLPRASGIDPRPLGSRAIPFSSPATLRMEVELPNRGKVTGMGIPEGVTLIVGGGFHGKSTLLNALELGVYNHIPGDGRELVVTRPDALKIRAADGRSISGTDISPFINNLPFGRSTTAFHTQNASGSTSQAAGICEGIEAGARLLLLDEDTSATNFMIRDEKMQHLVASENEPITPFIDRVKEFHDSQGVSTILVMGGSGDYFATADHVIQMTDYAPEDVTEKAHGIAKEHADGRMVETTGPLRPVTHRSPRPKSIPLEERRGRVKITTYGRHEMVLGTTRITFDDVEQIVEPSQTRALAQAVAMATPLMDGARTLTDILDRVMETVATQGLESLSDILRGDLAAFRKLELAAVINRARTLKTVPSEVNGGPKNMPPAARD
ncbi:ABC-ATPase domain-containing protein [Desulfoluna spongiiphila]|uniref:ABC-ATPase domain-containing protein n=1 Tax=Desulfoluna spongiiphila TaxID=419481 RepID=UPI0012590838|nr:ABC-ATPase domain-containing protein [Desulfoluna spongiiphila]VVS94930.1 abc transporter atpase putative [Desulfoluna spongiiphila]